MDRNDHSEPKKLDPAIRKVWAINFAFVTALAVTGLSIYEMTGWIAGRDAFFPTGGLTGLAVVIGSTITLIIPRLRYRYWSYILTADEMHLWRGILTRTHTIVPLRRLQHLDTSQNVVEREFDLARLIMHTAGTQGNSIVLPGLQKDDASRLRDELKQYILEDAVV